MKLKVKDVNLSTGGPLVAILNIEDARKMDLVALDRVKLSRLRSKKEAIAVVDISSKGIRPGEIGLFEELLKEMGITEGVHINLLPTERPQSIDFIKKKLNGMELSKKELDMIVGDIVKNKLSETEMTYFVSGCYTRGLNMKESAFLADSIVEHGDELDLGEKVVLDKHCVGGIAGNRTTPVVVSIIAAAGFKMPKTSSRSITSAAGTSDTVEVVAPVTLSIEKIREVVKKTNGCMAWGGAVNIAGADDKLIRIRHPLSIDPEGMLLASIMAKKKAVGSTHVLIDIPYGPGAKHKTKREAAELGKKFTGIGRLLGIKINTVFTDGSQPIGNGIGPALEMMDVISVLKGNGPTDLREKSILLATKMLEMVKVKDAHKKVQYILDSGLAYSKFKEIVIAQGGRKHFKIPKAKHFFTIEAEHDGAVKAIDNRLMNKIARFAGSPTDKVAGIYLRVHLGDAVKKGSDLFTIYTKTKRKLNFAVNYTKTVKSIAY